MGVQLFTAQYPPAADSDIMWLDGPGFRVRVTVAAEGTYPTREAVIAALGQLREMVYVWHEWPQAGTRILSQEERRVLTERLISMAREAEQQAALALQQHPGLMP